MSRSAQSELGGPGTLGAAVCPERLDEPVAVECAFEQPPAAHRYHSYRLPAVERELDGIAELEADGLTQGLGVTTCPFDPMRCTEVIQPV